MRREIVLTKELKKYDSKLFVKRDDQGALAVYRKITRSDHFYFDGNTFVYTSDEPHFVCRLTHNWKPEGYPVDWGIEPLMRRITSLDYWRASDIEEKVQRHNEKVDELLKKDRSNIFDEATETFARDVSKIADQYNFSGVDKKQSFKELEKKNIKER